jgi:hypothetical protein
MLLKEHKSPGKQGDAGLGVAIGWFATHGYTVCVPLTDSQEYDLVVEDRWGFKRVQVKTCRFSPKKAKNAGLQVELRTKSGRWDKVKKLSAKLEFLFVATDKDLYLIPASVVKGKTGICLGKKYDSFKIGR